jgi:release factor glutamine methyltransferase
LGEQRETYNIRQITSYFAKELESVYPQEERSEITRILLEEITGMSRAEILSCPLQPLSSSESETLFSAIERLKNHEPVQYILGKGWFYGLELTVSRETLIPRPETEELVQQAIKLFTNNPAIPRSFLDAGTGSGAIAVALASEIKDLKGYAFDILPGTLEIAIKNIQKHHVNVTPFIDDIHQFSGTNIIDEKVGMLISNPPYVRPSEKSFMRNNVTQHEPEEALYVPEEEPLVYYKSLKRIAEQKLVSGGFILFEINEAMAREMMELYTTPLFTDLNIISDMRGKDRIFQCQKN